MKTLYTFLFVLFSVSIFAQHHELQLEYQPFKKETLGQGGGINYYINLSPKLAIGLKGSFFNYEEETDHQMFQVERRFYSIDLTHRMSFINVKNFRVFGELGGTYTHEYYNSRFSEENYFIGCFVGVNFPSYFDEGPIQINRLGIIGSAGIDYSFFDKLTVGTSYSARAFLISDREGESSKTTDPLINFYLGFKF